MRKFLTLWAVMLVALTATAATINISPTSPYSANNLINALKTATAGDVIVLADGVYSENNDYIDFNKSVTVLAAEGAKPVVEVETYIKVQGGAQVKIQGIKFDGEKQGPTGENASSYSHFIRVYDAAANSLELENCEIYNTQGNVAIKVEADKKLNSLKINNCYFHDGANSAIYIYQASAAHACDKVEIINSTFANYNTSENALIEVYSKGGAIQPTLAEDVEIKVDHCTFYNFTKNAENTYGFIDSRKSANVAVSNCIFVDPLTLPSGKYNAKATQLYGGAVSNCLIYGVQNHRTDAITLVGELKDVDPLFKDAANADYTLGATSPALGAGTDASNLGDPRWWPAVASSYAVTFASDDAAAVGVVPAAVDVVDGESIKMPVNRTLYKAGYTLTGWSDGTNTYAIGADFTPTADVELKAVYTENATDFLKATSELKATWNFGEANGAPSVHWEGNAGILVAQTEGAMKVDVKLDVDATSGKFFNKERGDKWAQVNSGTKLSFPSKAGATAEVESYVASTASELDGATGTIDGEPNDFTGTYAATPSDGKSLFDVKENNYFAYLKVTYPATVVAYNITIDDEMANGAVAADMFTATAGKEVTLTIMPNANYELDELHVSGVDDDKILLDYDKTEATFTMPAQDVLVTATFKAIKYAVNIASIEHGSVVADKAEAAAGTTVTLTITPDANYELDALTVGEEAVSIASDKKSATFVMPGKAVTVNATFKAEAITKYAVTIASGIEHGNVVADKSEAAAGEDVTLTITADANYHNIAVEIPGVSPSDVKTTGDMYSVLTMVFPMPAQAVEVKAIFAENKLSLTEFIAQKPATAVTLKDLTVIYANGKNTYVIDEEGVALVMYDASKTYYQGDLTAGKVLSGQKATYTLYNNQVEIIPTMAVTATDGTAAVPTKMDALPTAADENKYIRLENQAVAKSGSNYYIGDKALQVYGVATEVKPAKDGNYDLEGIVINFKGTQLELIVTKLELKSDTPEPPAYTPEGDGSEANPYTVADVIGLATEAGTEEVWVKGYIIGAWAEAGKIDNTKASNIVLADAADETAAAKMIPIQLKANSDPRAALNVVDNNTIGAQVMVKGLLMTYFTVAGVKETSDYKIVKPVPTAIDNTETAVKAVKVMENGQIFILMNGKKYNVIGELVK